MERFSYTPHTSSHEAREWGKSGRAGASLNFGPRENNQINHRNMKTETFFLIYPDNTMGLPYYSLDEAISVGQDSNAKSIYMLTLKRGEVVHSETAHTF